MKHYGMCPERFELPGQCTPLHSRCKLPLLNDEKPDHSVVTINSQVNIQCTGTSADPYLSLWWEHMPTVGWGIAKHPVTYEFKLILELQPTLTSPTAWNPSIRHTEGLCLMRGQAAGCIVTCCIETACPPWNEVVVPSHLTIILMQHMKWYSFTIPYMLRQYWRDVKTLCLLVLHAR